MTYKPIWSQKATKINLAKPKNMEGWWITNKYDGVGSITTLNDIVQMYSISKAKVSGEFTEFTQKVPHIINELNRFNFKGLLQGELIATHLPTCDENFGFVTGTLHSFDAIERQQKGDYLRYVIYDMPSHTGKYKERYSALKKLFDETPDLQYVSLIPILGINKNNSWVDIYNSIVDSGFEGCVLYDENNVYKHSQTNNQRNAGVIKAKAINETEVLCIEKIEGKPSDKGGKFVGSLGALKCIDSEGRSFHCGSFKISDAERQFIWDNVDVPFVCEIVYYQITDNSYKLPRFTRYRPDKDESSWNRDDR